MSKAMALSATARIEGDPNEVILFGLAYVQAMDPVGWASDARLPQWVAQWAKGVGVFSTASETGGSEAFQKASAARNAGVSVIGNVCREKLIKSLQ